MMMNRLNNFTRGLPPVTLNLIIINVIIFLASFVLPRIGIDLLDLGGLHFYKADSFGFYQLFTYMFLHSTSGISHVLFNMFAVFMFGAALESAWGSRRFLFYYLFTGVGAGIVQQLVWYYSFVYATPIPPQYYDLLLTIGASGAVFGILLAFGMMYPNLPMYIMFIPIPVKAKYVVIGYAVIELLAGISNRAGDSIAHFAHLGGMLFGLILLFWWRYQYLKRRRY